MKRILAISLMLTSMSGFTVISEDKVIERALNSYPVILQAEQEVNNARASIKRALGNFDAKMSTTYLNVPVGYYLRRMYDTELAKPLGFMGSKVYTGYSYGPGFFPPQYSTQSSNNLGMPKVGFSLSLLKDRSIDENRGGVKKAEIESKQSELTLEQTKIQVQKEAAWAYWTWAAAVMNLKVFKNLLKVAEDKTEYIDVRVKNGDMPGLVMKEQNQYLASRRSMLASAELLLAQSRQLFSLFYRDDNGIPIVPNDEDAPTEIPLLSKDTFFDQSKDLEGAFLKRPEMKYIDLELKKLNIEKQLGRNDLMPKLDLAVDYNRYRVFGPADPGNAVHLVQVMLKLEVPFEFRLGQGRKEAVEALSRIENTRYNFLKETIQVEANNKLSAMKTAQTKVQNAQTEVQMAHELVEGEFLKFKSGGSSYFLLNAREEALAQAQANEVAAKLEFVKSLNDYRAEIMDFSAYR